MKQQLPIKPHNFFLASFSPTVAEHCCGREGLPSDSLKLDVSELMLRVISLTVDCKFQPLYFNFLIETKNALFLPDTTKQAIKSFSCEIQA